MPLLRDDRRRWLPHSSEEMARLVAYDMALDCDDPTNNDLDPTPPQPGDYDDWWTGRPEPWEEYRDMIDDEPLLGVLLGAPHEVIMPEGCSRAPTP